MARVPGQPAAPDLSGLRPLSPLEGSGRWGSPPRRVTRPLDQHRTEIERNLDAWRRKPLLEKIYRSFYERILRLVDISLPGRVVELGSGIGNLRTHLRQAICTDLFPNPWLDLACDGYELPFMDGRISHLILFDVFHHLERPAAFLREARRVLAPAGRLILFEPYISVASLPVYGLLHPEPVALRQPINLACEAPQPREYYAAQGNATRLFFRGEHPGWPAGWKQFHAEAFSSFCYLLSGGYSKPTFYPRRWLARGQRVDVALSRWPRLFGARCLVAFERTAEIALAEGCPP
jgi:SAM-dependent methyltransferase